MNRSHIIYAVFLVSTLLSLSLNSKAETITIAYNDAWPPYSSGSLDQAQGILIDLMDYLLADEPGFEIQHIGLPWNRVQTSIRSGRSDLFISVPTQQRLEYSYTSEQIIYEMHMLPVIAADNTELTKTLKLPSDLLPLRVCDLQGNGWSELFYKNLGKQNVFRAATVDTCLRMITANRMDVVVQPEPSTRQIAKQNHLLDQLIFLSESFGQMDFTLMLSKQSDIDPELLDRIDKRVSNLRESGEFERLLKQINAKY